MLSRVEPQLSYRYSRHFGEYIRISLKRCIEQSLLIRPADLLDKTVFLFERFATFFSRPFHKNLIIYVPQFFSIASFHNVTPHWLLYQDANKILTIHFILCPLLILDLQNSPQDVEQTPLLLENGISLKYKQLPKLKHHYYLIVENRLDCLNFR